VSRARQAEYWIAGRPPERGGENPASRWPSRLLADSGYFVSRGADGSQLIFDAGPHGFLNGGHAHADALSLVLGVRGEPVFIDPGTGSYTTDPAARDRFRSSRMHNTLLLDGREHAIPSGPFHWHSRADARLLIARTGPEVDFAAGTHDGYAPHRHIRAVLAMHGVGWLIVDRVTGPGEIAADTWWHLHPAWEPAVAGTRIELRGPADRRLTFASTASELAIVEEAHGFAPVYGRLERGAAIRASASGRERCVLASFVGAAAEGGRVEIVELQCSAADGPWVESRFGIEIAGAQRQVSVWFPRDPAKAEPDQNWPQPCIEQLVTSCVE